MHIKTTTPGPPLDNTKDELRTELGYIFEAEMLSLSVGRFDDIINHLVGMFDYQRHQVLDNTKNEYLQTSVKNMVRETSAPHTNDELREKLIPILMEFGSKFDPIERKDKVNIITDAAIDTILAAVPHSNQALIDKALQALPEKRGNHSEGYPTQWYRGYNAALDQCRKVLEGMR